MITFRSKINIGLLLFIIAIMVPLLILSIIEMVLSAVILLGILILFFLSISRAHERPRRE